MNTLMSERRWCVWKKEKIGDRDTKIPYVDQYIRGRSNDSDTWLQYQSAVDLKESDEEVAGLGFFLSRRERNDEYSLCVIDVDAHHGDGGNNPLAETILQSFAGTYAERSPSGNGYHIICDVRTDAIPLDCNNRPDFLMKNKDAELEIYIGGSTNRFMTYTGNQVSQNDVITDQTDAVLAFLIQYMKKPARLRTERMLQERRQVSETQYFPTQDVDIHERLQLASHSKDGEQFKRLYNEGIISDYADDHSAADFALVRKLCFWIGPDTEKIDEAFRYSALMREKWDKRRGAQTYGEMTINNALEVTRSFYMPPARQSENHAVSWLSELKNNIIDIDGIQENPDTSIQHRQITPEDILHMINEIEDDLGNRDRITVLPLMCGTGKSSALRLKMRQIIEANDGDGMIIITDNVDRMRDYLLPSDDDMRLFFMDYGHLITVMTYETIAEDIRNEPNCPILIMSTQRYINLSHEQIERYLYWSGGSRSLIVVDEQPYFKKQVDISVASLNDVYSAIQMGIPENPQSQDEKHELQDSWDVIRRYLERVITSAENNYQEAGQYYRWQQINWQEPERFDRIKKLLEKYRSYLNNYKMKGELEDIFSLVRAVHQIFSEGALFQMRRYKDSRKNTSLSVLLDNFSKFVNLDAKVIILDGTADLSTSYLLYPDDLDIVDCSQYKRDLSLLNIKLINLSTGKMTLKNDEKKRQDAFRIPTDYLAAHIEEGVQKAVFTYKFMHEKFARKYGEGNTSWFGRIKGSNDFRNARFIAQIGVNRYSLASYFLMEMAYDHDLIHQLERMDYADQTEYIENRMNAREGFTREATNRELLAELEQNIFRGTIRNSNSTDPYTFFLFTSFWHNDLIRCIHARYEPLNAHVEEEIIMPADTSMRFMKRMYPDGQRSHAQVIIDWHDHEVKSGTIYTYTDIIIGTGLTMNQIIEARKTNSKLNQCFKKERQYGKKAMFLKSNNWYYPDK